MGKIKSLINYFTVFERCLWLSSIALITVSFLLFDRSSYLSLAASLIGVTALIFCAKGNPVGQLLMIVFALIYGYISFTFAYYGEMMTYLCMSLPMAAVSFISWIRNPYKGNKAEVQIARVGKKEFAVIALISVVVTVASYFILDIFGTSNLIPSTLSVATSFFAASLIFRRSPWFALAYAVNDMVLIVLWSLAMLEDPSYVSVTVCFIVFLVNDMYSFINWRRMERRQK
jgi:nicotinamide mononucleotide transporter PnuC